MYWGSNMMADHLGWGIIEEEDWRKGPWTAEEDRSLIEYVRLHGEGRWNSVSRLAGLKRNGKSCRLRWVNYLRPDLKRGQITPHEESIILELHARWGNRWSTIARSLPGRTDNEIKNYWRTHFKKKAKVSSDVKENAKTRLLQRKHLHHHHQQQQQQLQLQLQQVQYQQQLQQLNQLDMKKMMDLLDGNDQAVELTNPSSAEEQGIFLSMINSSNGLIMGGASNEDIIWDGLWNLDDVNGDFNHNYVASKASMQTLVTPFC